MKGIIKFIDTDMKVHDKLKDKLDQNKLNQSFMSCLNNLFYNTNK